MCVSLAGKDGVLRPGPERLYGAGRQQQTAVGSLRAAPSRPAHGRCSLAAGFHRCAGGARGRQLWK